METLFIESHNINNSVKMCFDLLGELQIIFTFTIYFDMRPGEGDTYQLCFSIMFREAMLSKCYLTVLWWIFDGTTTSPGDRCPVAAEMIPWRHLHHVQPHPPPAPHLLPHVPWQLVQCRLRLWIRRQSLAGKQHIWQGDFIMFKHFLHYSGHFIHNLFECFALDRSGCSVLTVWIRH